jgi:hypothetical protein
MQRQQQVLLQQRFSDWHLLILTGLCTVSAVLRLIFMSVFILQRDTVKCKLVHSSNSQHGSLDATTICAEQSSDGSQQQLTIWSMRSISQPGQVEDSSSSSYAYLHPSEEGTEYGHRRRRAVHRKTLLHLVQAQ